MILLIFLLLFSFNAYADVNTDAYIIQKDDGSIVIFYYVPGSIQSPDELTKAMGFSSVPVKVDKSKIPSDRKFRNYWKFQDGEIILDQSKLEKDLLKKQEKELMKQTVLEKLKITKEDWAVLIS